MCNCVNPYCRHWRMMRTAILQRDGHRCQINGPRCRIQADTVDHIHGLHQGGSRLDPDNLRAACTPCNSGKSNRDRERRSVGWY